MQRIRHPGKAKPGRAAQRAPVFIFSPWLLSSLIGCLCIFGDVGQLNLATCQYFHVSMGSRYFAHSPSVRMQGDVDISSKDDPLQSNVCPSARTYFDRMLARVWQLPAAQDEKKVSRINKFPAISDISPSARMQGKVNTCSKVDSAISIFITRGSYAL